MSSSPSQNYPEPTPLNPAMNRQRRNPYPASYILPRQIVTDQEQVAAAEQQCQYASGNNVISCFPTADTVVPQHQWATLVWNSRLPQLTQTNLVDIFLFRADSLTQMLHFSNQSNPTDQAGVIRAQVNDTWFGAQGSNWAGQNISYPYFWIIMRSDATLDGSQIPQSTFTAVQTTFADSVVASMSSTATESASSASASSSSSSTPGSVQPNTMSTPFPHWAIALIAILGFLAIVASCSLAFIVIVRRLAATSSSNRNTLDSASPMMADIGNAPHSPLLPTAPVPQPVSGGQHAPSLVSPDGASTVSRAGSAEAGPFSGADAAIMADAFRKALRKPDFAGQPVEEDGPDSHMQTADLLNRELGEEGRGIRNVQSSRGVRVETLGASSQPRDSPS